MEFDNYFRENESRKVFGKAYSFHMLGILISAPLGSIIASKFGLNAPMPFWTVPALLSSLVALSIKEEKSASPVSESRRYLDIIKTGFSYFYHHKPLRLLAMDGILVSSSAYFVIWFYQPLLQKISLPIFYFGFVHAFLVTTEILVSGNFIWLEKITGGAGGGRARLTAEGRKAVTQYKELHARFEEFLKELETGG